MYREIITPTQSDCVIHLPKSYIGKPVEVIAFTQEEALIETETPPKMSFEEFTAFYEPFKVDTKGWKFDRNEANDYERGNR